MAEDFVLAVAEVVPQVSTSNYRVIRLLLEWEQSFISVTLRGEHGEAKTFTYGGSGPGVTVADRTKALNLMIALNKANLSIKSLQRRIIEQLIADGFLAGTVTGVPD